MTIARTRSMGPIYHPTHLSYQAYIKSGGNWILNGTFYSPPVNTYVLRYQFCQDELHRRRKGVYREGGPFFLKKLYSTIELDQPRSLRKNLWRYDTNFMALLSAADRNSALTTYNGYGSTAASWGATAYNKFRPVKPAADAAQFLVELRDLTSMFKFTCRRFKELGGAYLNGEFGWKPFLRDILKFFMLQDKLEKRIAFIRKNNGKWLRRAGTVKNDATTTTEAFPGNIDCLLNTYFWTSGTPPGVKLTVSTDRIWFVGVMKYYIDQLQVDSCKVMWTSPLLRKLSGLELTPSLLWELMPWSWFQDWFNNIGDILSNLSNQAYDNLVTKYAYVMRQRKTSIISSWSGNVVTDNGIVQAGPCKTTITAECKERSYAAQWGFGQLDDDDLSLRQWAILAALGVSRLPG